MKILETDVNLTLKAISRLVEEDADSFASRAEMYFKNRPQLMELVKELYRAYHTLAERYNHAARALHQTHRRVSEAFPSKITTAQIPDIPVPDTSDELQKDATIIFISGESSYQLARFTIYDLRFLQFFQQIYELK